jgi:hypothetical protein
MNLVELTIGGLAVYRVSHMIAFEDGPGDIIALMREGAGANRIGKLMDCPFCVSVWAALPVSMLFSNTVNELILNWLALSGASVVIERLTRKVEHDGKDRS